MDPLDVDVILPTSTFFGLQTLLKTAVKRAGFEIEAKAVTGLSASAQALFVARASRHKNSVSILVVPSDASVASVTADIRFFLTALEGLSVSFAHQVVLPFPSREVDPYRGLPPHFEITSARARVLHSLVTDRVRIIVASASALVMRVSSPEQITAGSADLTLGHDITPTALGDVLQVAGFVREDPVDKHGECCIRGGVVDFFPANESKPVRIEFVGDVVESIRRFDPATQRSTGPEDHVEVVPLQDRLVDWVNDHSLNESASFLDYLNLRGSSVFLSEPDEIMAQLDQTFEQITINYKTSLAENLSSPSPETLVTPRERLDDLFEGGVSFSELELALSTPKAREASEKNNPRMRGANGVSVHEACQSVVKFRGRLADWIADIRQAQKRQEGVLFVATTAGTAQRVIELLNDYGVAANAVDSTNEDELTTDVGVVIGQLTQGFRLPLGRLQIYTEADVFEEQQPRTDRRRSLSRTFVSAFRDLKADDFVVHVNHGVGMFIGLRQLAVGFELQEFMELQYADNAKLFVPVEHLDLVQKYVGGTTPPLDRLGGATWERSKNKVKAAMRDMAEELLKLYAARKAITGYSFNSDSNWQQEFEDGFQHELTPDQQTAMKQIKGDMEQVMPMDRLLCGDVGYGKTELAARAAFKAVIDGKQVALLAPTTVLAFQHAQTLKERFAAFPVRVGLLSRFNNKDEQETTLSDIRQGTLEIVVGTHRLLSKDVDFRNLGLLVVDEEQRFGVVHKERIKQIRQHVDVLTMTATPIPRTLNMSLAGIRDMSVIETPPKDRLAIQTHVVRFDGRTIERAIKTEMARGGQVYLVHNRVESIYAIADLVKRLVPEARVAVAHGQMNEKMLEHCMMGFVTHRFDVLIATTIIENGLDIPNANTIIVNQAHQFGLSQLYQLRGRIGRSDRRAYAYLLVPARNTLTSVARKRLAAIREFSELGSGFRIAALDLEIRGAGNLLGGEQSGHINAIGFEMYVKLLESTVRELKGVPVEDEIRVTVNIGIDLRIDEDYISDTNQRLSAYRRIASVCSDTELTQLVNELRDRYGPPTSSLLNLFEHAKIRMMAEEIGITSIEREKRTLTIKFQNQASLDLGRFAEWVQGRPNVTLVPPGILKVDLRDQSTTQRVEGMPLDSMIDLGTGSWWTAHAMTESLQSGFTHEDSRKPGEVDPFVSGGLFHNIVSLLTELRDSARISYD